MSTFDQELAAAEANGERTVVSLYVGDQFYYRGRWFVLYRKMQMHCVNRDQVHVFVIDDTGRKREFLFHPQLMFPCLITDEHAAREQAPPEPIW